MDGFTVHVLGHLLFAGCIVLALIVGGTDAEK
jgi:hypothetical protein